MINKLTADANESSTHCFKGAHVAGLVFCFFVFLPLNYRHNYVLVASALNNQIMETIYLSEWMANCGGVLSLVCVINQGHVP